MQRGIEPKILELAEQDGVTPEGFEAFSLEAWLWDWPEYARQVDAAIEALRHLPRVSKRRAVSNYWLKHVLERRHDTYISPGACIIAALILGIDVWREGKTRNALIGVSVDSAEPAPQYLPSRALLFLNEERPTND